MWLNQKVLGNSDWGGKDGKFEGCEEKSGWEGQGQIGMQFHAMLMHSSLR